MSIFPPRTFYEAKRGVWKAEGSVPSLKPLTFTFANAQPNRAAMSTCPVLKGTLVALDPRDRYEYYGTNTNEDHRVKAVCQLWQATETVPDTCIALLASWIFRSGSEDQISWTAPYEIVQTVGL